MRKPHILVLFILTIISGVASAQLSSVDYKGEEFARFKASKTYFVKTGNQQFDDEAINAMKDSWKVTSYDVIDHAEFTKKITDKSSSFIVNIIIEVEGPNRAYHYLAVFNGGKKKLNSYSYDDMVAYSPINHWAGEPNNTDCAFRVRNMLEGLASVIEIVQKNDIKGNPKKIAEQLRDYYNKSASKIKGRTLLVNEEQLTAKYKGKEGKKISKQEFGGKYPFKFEFVPQSRIAEVIQQKSTEYYYLQLCATLNKMLFVIDPSNGEIVYFDFHVMGMNVTDDDVEDLTNKINGKK